jgi:LuxR family maltose regulon positive regulatory protein
MDLREQAIRHALLAGDFPGAADLIESTWSRMESNHESGEWISQVTQLPEELVLRYPVLCAGYGWISLYTGQMEAATRWLDAAAAWLRLPEGERNEMRVADRFQFDMLPASLHSASAFMAISRGDYGGAIDSARKALDIAGESPHLSRTQAWSILGVAQFAAGDLEGAEGTITRLIEHLHAAGRTGDALELTFVAADIRILRGELRRAFQSYQRAFAVLAGMGDPVVVGMEDLYRGVVDLYREWGTWDAAEEHLEAARNYGALAENRPDWLHRLNLSAARLALSRGDFDAAVNHAEEASRHFHRTAIPHLYSASAITALARIRQGKLSDARRWADACRPEWESGISLVNEFDHLVYVRLLLSEAAVRASETLIREALDLLGRLWESAVAGGRTGRIIEIRMLQAMTHDVLGNDGESMRALEESLSLAGPEGYIRIYADEGAQVRALLEKVRGDGGHGDYVSRILEAFRSPVGVSVEARPLAEPLSEREFDVLRLLAGDLGGPDIAAKLYISLSTLRTHTRNIYGKLGVNDRRAAVRTAKNLNLL